MDLGILLHHAESTHYLTRRDSEAKFWIFKYTEIGPVFDSRLPVIMTFMDSRFRSPPHLETTPKFGWSYPETQIADVVELRNRESQNLPEEVANVYQIKIKCNRLLA